MPLFNKHKNDYIKNITELWQFYYKTTKFLLKIYNNLSEILDNIYLNKYFYISLFVAFLSTFLSQFDDFLST
jgi:hypothetical protein